MHKKDRESLAMIHSSKLWWLLVALLTITAETPARAADTPAPPSGLWDAGVVVSGVLIPFRFELAITGDTAS
ncbi:MAG TPA: hypothetical protein VGC79_19935, partial [Polyangiaceae bacterium]